MRPHTLRRVLVSFAIVGAIASLGIQRVVGERGSPASPFFTQVSGSSSTSLPPVVVEPGVDPEDGQRLDQERASLRELLMQPLPSSDDVAHARWSELPVAQ